LGNEKKINYLGGFIVPSGKRLYDKYQWNATEGSISAPISAPAVTSPSPPPSDTAVSPPSSTPEPSPSQAAQPSVESYKESFDSFWYDFRASSARCAFEDLKKMTLFPLETRGPFDSDPFVYFSEDEFSGVYYLFLRNFAGVNLKE
jgi:hypothetical protein